MNHQITHKLAAVIFAILMNGVMLGSLSYLFAPPATAMAQSGHGTAGALHSAHGVA